MIGVSTIIFISLFACVSALSFCPRHSYYSSCGDSCAPTCHRPRRLPSCESQCTSGCFCERGYYKNHHGDCVESRGCYSGSDSDSDSRRHSRSSDRSTKSTKSTRSTSSDSDSDSDSHERLKCGPNEKYARCKQRCPETCKRRHPRSCKHKCKRRGCVCKSGFVKDKYNNCIPQALCPNKNRHCRVNEKWSNATCVAPPSCQVPNCRNPLPSYCPLYCTNGGCVCKDGYLRGKKGKCVLADRCDSSESSDESTRSSDRSTRSSDKSTRSSDRSTRSSRRSTKSCESNDSSPECKSYDRSSRRRHRGSRRRHRSRSSSRRRSSEYDCDKSWSFEKCGWL